MNLNAARIIDGTAGVVLCLALDGYNRLFGRFRNRSVAPDAVRRILVMKFWGMGSIVLAAPAVRAIRRSHPGAHVTALSFAGNRDILEATGLMDEVTGIGGGSVLGFLAGLPRVIALLRRRRFDLVVDFEFFTRISAIFAYLVGRGARVGFYEPQVYRGRLLTHRIPFDIDRHVAENFMALAGGMGCAGDTLEPFRLRVPDAGRAQVRQWLAVKEVPDDARLICVNVNASGLSLQRRWPRERFAQVLRFLVSVPRVRPVLIGAPGDRPYVEEVKRTAGGDDAILVAAGPLSVKGLLALLERSELLVTNDSGPLHFAVALGIRTISFFGPESPRLYGPAGDEHTVFYKDIYCSPCLHAIDNKMVRCRNPRCVRAITAGEVNTALGQVLAAEPATEQPANGTAEGRN